MAKSLTMQAVEYSHLVELSLLGRSIEFCLLQQILVSTTLLTQQADLETLLLLRNANKFLLSYHQHSPIVVCLERDLIFFQLCDKLWKCTVIGSETPLRALMFICRSVCHISSFTSCAVFSLNIFKDARYRTSLQPISSLPLTF